MNALVALLSPDFHDSNWTDQEVGVAIGRGVPLIAVRLGLDPYGLMGKGQGLGGCGWADTDNIAINVFHLLQKRLPDKSRLFECALASYAESESFADSAWRVQHLLSGFRDLSSTQVERLLAAYQANGQNRSSFKGMDLLCPLLKQWTGKEWTVVNNELSVAKAEVVAKAEEDAFPQGHISCRTVAATHGSCLPFASLRELGRTKGSGLFVSR